MAVFRGNKRKKPSEETRIEPDTPDYLEAQAPLPQADDSNYRSDLPRQTVGEEREQLDRHRSRANQEPADYYSPPKESNSATKQPSLLRKSLGLRKQGKRQPGGKGASSALGRKVAIGLVSLLMPTLIGLVLFYLFLGAGGNLEHINRITNGIRFAGLHGEIRKRANHINKVYTLELLGEGKKARAIARQQRPSLAKKLFTGGWDANKARLNLVEHNIDIKYRRFQLGPNFLQRTIDTVDYGDGKGHVPVKTQADVDRLHRTINSRLPSATFHEWLHTQATARWVAKRVNMPFSRFRGIISRLRAGDLTNTPRVVRTALTTSILNSRIARRLVPFQSAISGGDINRQADVLSEEIKDGDIVDTKQARRRLRELHRSKFINNPIRNLLSKAGILAGITEFLTWSCMFDDLGDQIESAFRLRIGGAQESASTLLTLTNQMKSGEAHPQVIADFSKRFEGFDQSATYKTLVSDLPFNAEVDFSQAFSSAKVFGMSIEGMRTIASWLGGPARFTFWVLNGLINVHNLLPLVFQGLWPTIPNISCRDFLHPAAQLTIITLELIATFIPLGSLLKAGPVAVGKATMTAIKVGWGRLLGQLALAAGGVGLEVFIFNHVVPIMMENISGVDTSLLPGPDDIDFSASSTSSSIFTPPVSAISNKDVLYVNRDIDVASFYQGAQNFATVDYGMHYLKEQRGLMSGASHRSAAEETRRTIAYMDAYQSQFAQKGLFNNLFALDNPFSIASTLSIKRPKSINAASSQLAGLLTGIFGHSLFGNLFSDAHAQPLNQEQLRELLYPGQRWVIGFDEAELDGERDFDFLDNSQWVEENLDDLVEDFADCLVLDVGSFLYAQTYEKGSRKANALYPPKCYEDVEPYQDKYDRSEAVKRFKLYFQDCVLVESITLEGTGQSPFFSTACEHLLPAPTQENGLANPIRYEDYEN